MRNSKVKLLKKAAVITMSMLFATAGATFADAAWDSLVGQQTTSPKSMSLSGNATATSTLNFNTPPVPASGTSYSINGANHTISGENYDGTIIKNTNGAVTTITNTSITNAKNTTAPDVNNEFGYGGGAVSNEGSTLTVTSTATSAANRSELSNNTAVNGGAIMNTGNSILNINSINFNNNKATAETGNNVAFGGAIFNGSSAEGTVMTIRNSAFTGNQARMVGAGGGYGGAVYHHSGSAVISNTDFSANYATSGGGAIANRANLVINSGSLSGNHTTEGGAISNGYVSNNSNIDATVTITNTEFKGNYATSSGGAIANKPSDAVSGTTHTVIINEGTKFTNNYVANGSNITSGIGAAIMNNGTRSDDTKDAVLIINGGNSDSEKVLFQNNITGSGSAIYNRGVATVNNAIFRENGFDPSNTVLASTAMTSRGGAIYNTRNNFTVTTAEGSVERSSAGEVTISNSLFEGNRVSRYGGAIYNVSKATIIDSDFVNNSAGNNPEDNKPILTSGGAIYTATLSSDPSTGSPNAETVIIAQNKDVNIGNENSLANQTDSIVIQGTQNTGSDNYIATVTMQAADNRTINVNSNVYGSVATDGALLANLNVGDAEKTYNGTVRFNGDASLTSTNVNLYSGTLAFAHDRSFGPTNVLNMAGGTLDLLNGEFGNYQLQAKAFNLVDDSNIRLDVDLANKRMDGLFTENFVGGINNPDGKTLTVQDMYAWTDTSEKEVMVKFTDAPSLIGRVAQGSGARIVQSPTTKYVVEKIDIPDTGEPDDEHGVYFGFKGMGSSDPAISGPVAAQAAFIMMDNIYRQSFANMDMVALMTPEQRMAWKMRNKYADAGYHRGVFAPNVIPEERDGIYARPFANFENVPLKNGPRVSNVFYGSLIGGESDIIDLGHGWDGNFSFFGAYHGSHQAYNGIDIWQNGGTVGAVGTVYKGRFWSGLTANIGASAAEARHGFGNDQFPILMTGAAWKSGYNWGLANNKFIIQPSYMMSYTFVNVFDYTSASGARITQDPLNAIEIIPGLKLIGNLQNGWQPYLGVNMTWNIMDEAKFYANQVALERLSVKPFIEYGLGMQKRYGDRFTGFGQMMFRSGGRNGVAFTLGLRWALGN